MSNKNKSEMKSLTWKDGCAYLWQSLGISEGRANELDYRLRLIIHEIMKPLKDSEEGPDSGTFIKMCLALAQTEEERVFCAYVAGGKVQEIFETGGEFENYNEEDVL